jgi:hypothetical protein
VALLDAAREWVSQALEAQRFISRHKLIKDPDVKGRYYLSAARDRFIDADLTDPEVRAGAEETIRDYRTNVKVRKNRGGKKDAAADTVLVDTSSLRFIPPEPARTPSTPSRKGRRG